MTFSIFQKNNSVDVNKKLKTDVRALLFFFEKLKIVGKNVQLFVTFFYINIPKINCNLVPLFTIPGVPVLKVHIYIFEFQKKNGVKNYITEIF